MKEYKKYYLNETVQDIFHLIESDFLLKSMPGISLFPENYNRILKEGLKEICQEIDVNNRSIEKLNKARGKRLGLYCEALLNEYFLYHPKIEIVSHGWQIIRDNVTIGELDFILKIDGQMIGLETSFKCYLQFGNELKDWQGPNRKDALINKLEKVKNKQLPLFQGEEVMTKFGVIPSFLFLKGHLFSEEKLPFVGLKQAEFTYLYEEEVDAFLTDGSYFLFPKPYWVSGLYFSPNNLKLTKKEILEKIKIELDTFRPPIIGIRLKSQNQNYFIIRKK